MSTSMRRPLLTIVLAGFLAVGCAGSEQVTQPDDSGQTSPQPAQATAPDTAASPDAGPTSARPPLAPIEGVDLDTVRSRRFDNGKMWTFDSPPIEYFQDEYGIAADEEWFRDARLGALRFSDNCSASFVSPNGLIATNHHCGRESVVEASGDDEDLLESGFYASTVEDERPVEGLYVEQLVGIEDVTDSVYMAIESVESTSERAQARQQVVDQLQSRLNEATDDQHRVEVVSLYHGARYSAYTYRRYEHVRLVAAPELDLGFYGGDPDNFTYPRYALDFTFFRAYDGEGEPLEVETYFEWSTEGAEPGDATFVVGNPGATSRLETVSQLEYRRDYEEPIILRLVRDRVAKLRAFAENEPETADSMDLRNEIFSLENTIKAYGGRVDALRNPVLMQRRRHAEEQFKSGLRADSSLWAEYGGLFDEMAEVQNEKRQIAHLYGAFVAMSPNSMLSSNVLVRALYASRYLAQKQSGAPQGQLASMRGQALGLDVRPLGMERGLIAARFEDFRRYLGSDHALVKQALQGRSPEEAAARLVDGTALVDSARTAQLLDRSLSEVNDPALSFAQAFIQAYGRYVQQIQSLNNQEQELLTQLARARYGLRGTAVPPDATFTLRIADGRIQDYEYNGTIAPPYTTYFGLYDHHYSYPGDDDWDLPQNWLTPSEGFEMDTPLNIVSTNDIVGGNSGSPMLNEDLEVVGLVFDGNIESLSGAFIYRKNGPRTISVDVRGVTEALDDVYDADRLVQELREGTLVETEAEAVE